MTIKQIAQSVAAEYDLPVHEIKRKQYWGNPHYSMKLDFIEQARKQGFSNAEVADFMNYAESTTSEMYSITISDQPRYKWQRILKALKEGKAVTKDDFGSIKGHIARIREEGYYPYRTPEGEYKLG